MNKAGEWKIEIKKAENGFILEWDEWGDNYNNRHSEVYEEPENDEFAEQEALIEALWSIVNHFGLQGSKHDKKRICIELKDN